MFKFTLSERTVRKFTVQQAIDQAVSVIKVKYPTAYIELRNLEKHKRVFENKYPGLITVAMFDDVVYGVVVDYINHSVCDDYRLYASDTYKQMYGH